MAVNINRVLTNNDPTLYEEVINGNIKLYDNNFEHNANVLCSSFRPGHRLSQLWMQHLKPVPTTSFEAIVRCRCAFCGNYHEIHTSDWVDLDKIKQTSWEELD